MNANNKYKGVSGLLAIIMLLLIELLLDVKQ